MNKTAEKGTPFGPEQNSIADTIDQTVRDAVASSKAKQGASLNMKKLDVEKLCIFVLVLTAKKKKQMENAQAHSKTGTKTANLTRLCKQRMTKTLEW